jgi:hypothetical protein
MTTVLYIIYFDGWTRFTLFKDNFIYGLNDSFFVIQIYHFMCFTLYNPVPKNQYLAGDSMVMWMIIMLVINLIFIVVKVVSDIRKDRQLKAIKERKLATWKLRTQKKEADKIFGAYVGYLGAMKNTRKYKKKIEKEEEINEG